MKKKTKEKIGNLMTILVIYGSFVCMAYFVADSQIRRSEELHQAREIILNYRQQNEGLYRSHKELHYDYRGCLEELIKIRIKNNGKSTEKISNNLR